MGTDFHGVQTGLALFSSGTQAVLINISTLDVFDAKTLGEFDLDEFTTPGEELTHLGLLQDLADEALPDSEGDVTIIASHKPRTYRVPKAVQENAQYALSQVRKTRHYGDPVAMFAARTLARGGSLPLSQIKHMARYFAMASVRTAEESLSTEDKLSWELFGGDAARRWAFSISGRHSPVVAAAEDEEEPEIEDVEMAEASDEDINGDEPHVFEDVPDFPGMCMYCGLGEFDEPHVAFDDLPEGHPQRVEVEELEDTEPLEPAAVSAAAAGTYDDMMAEAYPDPSTHTFYAERFNEDPYVLVALFSRDLDDNWKKFDSWKAKWKDCSPVDPDIDIALMDEDAAYGMVTSQADKPGPVDLRELYPEETTITEMASDAIDDDLMLLGPADAVFAEQYTPVERSKNASRQVRDKNGRFARMGTKVATNAKRDGRVVGFDRNRNKVEVKMDDTGDSEYWNESEIQVRQIGKGPNIGYGNKPFPVPDGKHVTKAKLRQRYPLMSSEEIQTLFRAYKKRINDHRKAAAHVNLAELDPTTSDVAPVYVAIVDKLDPTAVLDLVSLAPESDKSDEIAAFRREDKKWVKDDNLLLQLKSVAPPPVVSLDQATYEDVVKQVDAWTDSEGSVEEAAPSAPENSVPPAQVPEQADAVSASGDVDLLLPAYGEYGETIALAYEGGLDRNRGNAERLRHYWLYGPGAAKILWNTPGDWTRCVGFLSKYLGTRARGYCSLRHKEATGMWTGDRLHRMRGFSDAEIPTTEEVITASLTRAALIAADYDAPIPDTVDDVEEGAKFVIPTVVPIGVETGDGRTFADESLSTREFPLPLMWQIKTGDQHDGSVIVGRIDGCQITPNGLVNAYGVLDTGVYAQEAERLIRNGFLRGISGDLDKFEASINNAPDEAELGEDNTDLPEKETISAEKILITGARLTGATLVPKPAFQETVIELIDQSEEPMPVDDGVYVEAPDEADVQPLMAAALVASSIPVHPPASWFENPALTEATPLQVDDHGRVFGHIAAWYSDHIGLPFSTKPPRSRSNYAYFHTGVLSCDDDSKVPVGQLTLAGGHASLDASASEAVRHYDDTASAVADVHAGEDEHGIWVAGALRPGVTPEQIRTLRASAPSGDWRPINGRLEMVAVCQVNVPGFPITRARVASGHMYALVAAGASVLAKMRQSPWDTKDFELDNRLAQLEEVHRKELSKAREAAVQLVAPVRDEHQAALIATAAALKEKVNSELPDEATAFADVSIEQRKKYAKRGFALPDGSYPIPDVSHLKKAIQAYGRANPEDRGKVRRHIMKRARGLGRTDLIPEKWTSASLDERMQDAKQQFTSVRDSELRAEAYAVTERFTALAESQRERRMISKNPDFDEAAHPRDAHGKFRDVVAKIRDSLKNTPEAEEALRELDTAEQAEAEKNFEKARLASDRVIHILDSAAQGARNIGAAETMRDAAKQLGKVIAFLPVPVGEKNVAASYEQLAPEVQHLIQELVKRAEKVSDPSEDASEDLENIKGYISGGDQWTQPELNAALSRLIRLLL